MSTSIRVNDELTVTLSYSSISLNFKYDGCDDECCLLTHYRSELGSSAPFGLPQEHTDLLLFAEAVLTVLMQDIDECVLSLTSLDVND